MLGMLRMLRIQVVILLDIYSEQMKSVYPKKKNEHILDESINIKSRTGKTNV